MAWGRARVFFEGNVGIEVMPNVHTRMWAKMPMPDDLIEDVVITHVMPEKELPPFGMKVECKEARAYIGRPYSEWIAGLAQDVKWPVSKSEPRYPYSMKVRDTMFGIDLGVPTVDVRTMVQETQAALNPPPILWYGDSVPVKDSRPEQLRRVARDLFEMAAAMDRGELEYSSGDISISTTPGAVVVVSDISFQRK